MHSGLFKLLTDSEYRDKLFSDIAYWLIMIGLSYFILLVLHRDLFIKTKSFKFLLLTAIGLSIAANLLHYMILNTSTAIMILNAPLICLTVYRLSYEGYLKLFNIPPLSPLDMTYNFNEGLTKDRIFNFFVLLTIALTSGLLIMIK
jgi:hypothetical protein